MRAPLPPALPLRKPADGTVALPLSIVVDIVDVSRLGEGERILRVEDTLKAAGEDRSEVWRWEMGDGLIKGTAASGKRTTDR